MYTESGSRRNPFILLQGYVCQWFPWTRYLLPKLRHTTVLSLLDPSFRYNYLLHTSFYREVSRDLTFGLDPLERNSN